MAAKKKEDLLYGVHDKTSAEQALKEAGAGYEKSQAVQDAQKQLEQYMESKPGEYVSGYQQKIDGLLDQILNREGFSYDFSTDPMYQTYKNQYVHQGKLAMQDSMAGAAALTGGYGSSFAMAAGSQAYQGYLNQLNDKIPELYQMALDRYDSEGKGMHDALDQLMGAEKASHDAYQKQLDSYYKGLDRYMEMADSAYEHDYGEYQDFLESLTDMRDYYANQDQQAFRRKQDELAHELAVKKFEESIRQWQAEQAAAAAKQAESTRRWEIEQANARKKWQAQLALNREQLAFKREQLAYKKMPTEEDGPIFPIKDLTKKEKFELYLGEMGSNHSKKPRLTKKDKAGARSDWMMEAVNGTSGH